MYAYAHNLEKKFEHLLESLEAPLSLFLLFLVHFQHSLESGQGCLGVILFNTLGAVVLILYGNLLIISGGLTIICILLFEYVCTGVYL